MMKLPVAMLAMLLAIAAQAEDSLKQDAKDLGQDVKHAGKSVGKFTKKTVRSAKDKTCELVDGKMNCAAKKLKHKAQNAVDDIKGN